MPIFIPFPSNSTIGGPSTFMANLRSYLDQINFPYHLEYQTGDAIFFPISYDLNLLKKIKKSGQAIIQRLDGIYYPSKHGADYLNLNQALQEIYQNYASTIIFQSQYSQKQCQVLLGQTQAQRIKIIYNGADRRLFYPASARFGYHVPQNLISTGNFRNLDMIEPLITAIDRLWREQLKFRLHLVGPINNPQLKSFFHRPYIKYHGALPLKAVARLLRRADIFVYSHLNPPCPNSVIEAISTGLPVVGFASGAMRELCHFNTDLLAPVSEEIFQKYQDIDSQKLGEKIKLCWGNFPFYQKRALAQAHLYDFKQCGQEYVRVFTHLDK